jgi:photosystem II stability/assembly factor-like uncharacterized protein
MRARIWGVLNVAGVLLGLASAVQAQSFKLLAPNVGWMSRGRGQLLWTTDGGHNWKDITPPMREDVETSAVFFLDTKLGWIPLAHGSVDLPGNLHYELARTVDGGNTWSVQGLNLPRWSSRALFNGGAWLAFADPNHGLLALATGLTPISAGRGALFATSDGGVSWVGVGGSPRYGNSAIWLAGGRPSQRRALLYSRRCKKLA